MPRRVLSSGRPVQPEIRVTARTVPGRIAGMTAQFLPGLRLAEEYHAEVVRPLLYETFPGLPYSAARLGSGSEVLGFDSERSTDHDWGPRLQIFLTAGDVKSHAADIIAMFANRIPASFRGYPTAFPRSGEPGGEVRHWVEVAGLGAWLTDRLGFDPRQPATLLDWLATPTQRLAEITAGGVFHDGLGELSPARTRLAWYPRDMWLYVLACQWQRISQEEAFVGRCAEAGDDLGSAVVTARLARDLMRLCLLMHRSYPPYSKWLGTAFGRLRGAGRVAAPLTAALSASSWLGRQRHLCQAYEATAAWHNELGVTEPLDIRTRRFWDRPYQVLNAGRFTAALLAEVADPRIRRLPSTGASDQFIDSTDALENIQFLRDTIAAALRPEDRDFACGGPGAG